MEWLGLYSKDMLIGILLSSANPKTTIMFNDNARIGYSVRLEIEIRGNSEYLSAISRTLSQHMIECYVVERESNTRPKPILKITKVKSISILCEKVLPNHLPSKTDWKTFRSILEIVKNKKHHTLQGIEEIFKLKGITYGINECE